MNSLDPKYSRVSFDALADAEGLSRELAVALTERIRQASVARDEVWNIVAELRELGHDLSSWDEDDDWETWGGDYVRSQAKRMIVEFRYPEGSTAVHVTFGPWPRESKSSES
jgi:hypothetical protein